MAIEMTGWRLVELELFAPVADDGADVSGGTNEHEAVTKCNRSLTFSRGTTLCHIIRGGMSFVSKLLENHENFRTWREARSSMRIPEAHQ